MSGEVKLAFTVDEEVSQAFGHALEFATDKILQQRGTP